MLLLTVCEYDQYVVKLRTPSIFREVLKMEDSTLVVRRERGSENVLMQSSDPMTADYAFYIALALDDPKIPRQPVEQLIEQIAETVENVIPRFDSFLD